MIEKERLSFRQITMSRGIRIVPNAANMEKELT